MLIIDDKSRVYVYRVYVYSIYLQWQFVILGEFALGGGGGGAKLTVKVQFEGHIWHMILDEIKVGKSVIPRFGVILTEKSISFIIFMIQFQGQICNKNKIFNK